MKAYEALEASKDGKIWLNGRAARKVLCESGWLIWIDIPMGSILEVGLSDTCSDQWEPEKGIATCMACEEAKVLDDSPPYTITCFISNHLKKYHCTCDKK